MIVPRSTSESDLCCNPRVPSRHGFLVALLSERTALFSNLHDVRVFADVGGADGDFVDAFSKAFHLDNRVGLVLDFNPKHLTLAKRKFGAIQCDIDGHIPLRADAIHICSLISVIEHVKRKEAILTAVNRIMVREGLLLIQNPNPYFPLDIHFQIPFWFALPGFMKTFFANFSMKRQTREYGLTPGLDTYYTEYVPINVLIGMLKKAGFRVEACISYVYPQSILPSWALPLAPLLKLVPRVLPMGHLIVAVRR